MHLLSDFGWVVYASLYEWFNCSFTLLKIQSVETTFSNLHLIFAKIGVHLF